MSAPVVTGRPEARSMAPKPSMARMRSRATAMSLALRGDEAGDAAAGQLAPEPLDVLGVLDHAAQGLGHELLVEMIGVERGQGLRPVERFGHPGHLGQADGPHRLHEERDLPRQALVDARHLASDDAHFLVEAGEIYPEIETAA